ncbi:integrase, catalytic region, zinc finger, CCHC-type containing protein [Tanacetum coccineum]
MDSIIPLGQKNTLAEYMILFGADNRPPMLDKDLYDSWKSIMELYMQNREHGRMILESVENGPLIWPTIEENGVTRTKKYAELSAAEKIQADCDMKATNIILQGLPADIYSLVNHHRVAKDLWERVQLLMQGTSLTKQERECKLYDAFDKFTHIKGESLHKYYLRFTQLINDMNIYNMKMEQFQVNTKFLNSLPPEWIRLLRERNQDPLAFVTNQQMTPPHFNTYQSSYNNPQLQQQFPPSQYGSIHPNQHYSSTYPSQPQFNNSSVQQSYPYQSQMNHQTSYVPQITYQSPQVSTQPMTESPFMDSSFAVPIFSLGDDPIACLNKGIQGQSYSSIGYKSNATSSRGNNASGHAKVVKCYNCQGEGHMARQCTQPKRPRNAAWYKDKAMLAEAQRFKKWLTYGFQGKLIWSRSKLLIFISPLFDYDKKGKKMLTEERTSRSSEKLVCELEDLFISASETLKVVVEIIQYQTVLMSGINSSMIESNLNFIEEEDFLRNTLIDNYPLIL